MQIRANSHPLPFSISPAVNLTAGGQFHTLGFDLSSRVFGGFYIGMDASTSEHGHDSSDCPFWVYTYILRGLTSKSPELYAKQLTPLSLCSPLPPLCLSPILLTLCFSLSVLFLSLSLACYMWVLPQINKRRAKSVVRGIKNTKYK